jgi:mRNA-degrading endonuclease toxin of MazEF toxin-antitoxin module
MVYLHEIALPGEPSGGRHLCVCLSRREYSEETGLAVLASVRKVPSNWWRPLVDHDDFSPNAGYEPLDQARAVDTSQMESVPVTALAAAAGRVSARVVEDAMEMLPALFQLRGPWEVRGAVHQIRGWPEQTTAVLVLNDDALDNPDVRHFLVVPYEEGDWRKALVLVSAADLGPEVRVLSDAEQVLLSRDLGSIFPLTSPMKK